MSLLIYYILTQATSRSLNSVTTKVNTACHLRSWGWFMQLPTAIGCSVIHWCEDSSTLFSFSMKRSNSEQQRQSRGLTTSWSEQREHFRPTNEALYTWSQVLLRLSEDPNHSHATIIDSRRPALDLLFILTTLSTGIRVSRHIVSTGTDFYWTHILFITWCLSRRWVDDFTTLSCWPVFVGAKE